MSQLQASVVVSPLRRRMLDDMAMRGLREETQRDYIRFVRSFAAVLGRCFDLCSSVHALKQAAAQHGGGRAERPFYPDDLLPRLQQTLAILADVQIRFEIERDYLRTG